MNGEIIDLASARVASYTFLSLFLRREPTAESLERLDDACAGLKDDEEAFCANKGLLSMAAYVRGFRVDVDGGGAEACRRCLAADFARTFLMGKGCVHPYESVYTSDKGLLMRGAYRATRMDYAAAGYVVDESSGEMADHVALQLEFMAHLSQRLLEALQKGNFQRAVEEVERQKSFAAGHFGWIPRLAHDMQSTSRTDFYRGLATMLEEAVVADAAFLEDIASAAAADMAA